MARAKKREPLWPLGLMLAVVAVGVGVGALFPGTFGSGESGVVADLENEEAIPEPGHRVRVEVLNGGGVRGMAGRATEVLRDGGFDVVFFGTAENFAGGGSVVLVRTADRDAAEKIATALGIEQVRVEPDETLLVDVTVLLGSEWNPAAER
jgi:hypothetical protein